MAEKQSMERFIDHRGELANALDPHVDSLIKKFSDLKLLSDKDTKNLEAKPKQDKIRVNFFLDIVHGKMESNDSKSYEELITFMKSAQEYSLPSLANKMTNPEEVPFGQPMESESSPQVVQCKYCIIDILQACKHKQYMYIDVHSATQFVTVSGKANLIVNQGGELFIQNVQSVAAC